MRSFALASILLLACIGRASAVAFDLPSDTKRCFVEEVPGENNFVLTYTSTDAKAQFLDTFVYDPSGSELWSAVAQSKGKFSYVVDATGGEYKICFSARSVGWGTNKAHVRKVSFLLKMDMDDDDYNDLATVEKLKPLEVQVRVMGDTVRAIHTEYIYYKEKEAEMRSTNEHMTAKVAWMSVAIILIFILFSVWQLRHLKFYFKKKRMID